MYIMDKLLESLSKLSEERKIEIAKFLLKELGIKTAGSNSGPGLYQSITLYRGYGEKLVLELITREDKRYVKEEKKI